MRAVVAAVVLAFGCVGEFEAPAAEECELLAPDTVAIGERFAVEVRCLDQAPAWLDFDFGDGTPAVRTSAMVREHEYGPAAAEHRWFRVQVAYIDVAGDRQVLEARVYRGAQ